MSVRLWTRPGLTRRLHFAHSTSVTPQGSPRVVHSRVFRALDTHDLRRGLRGHRTNRTLACISRTRHARSPQRVARAYRQIALSPAFRALDTHDLRRGLRAHGPNRTLACISRTRRARSPQRVARAHTAKSHSRLHFAHSTRTISAEGCARTRSNRTLACISRARHARSPQRVARASDKSHSRLHFAHSTRTISAEGCAHTGQIALSPAFRSLDTHDLRRGLHFRLTLFVPPSAFKERIYKVGKCFSLGHLPCKFSILTLAYSHCILHFYTCILLHLDTCRWMLSLFHLHWGTYRSVSVHVHVQV